MDSANNSHWKSALRVIRNLKGTKEFGLLFRTCHQNLIGYSESDFASDNFDHKSVSGFVFLLNGSAIFWRSKKQTIVAQSTTEAKYVAMSFALREAVWIRSILNELRWYICSQYCYNQN